MVDYGIEYAVLDARPEYYYENTGEENAGNSWAVDEDKGIESVGDKENHAKESVATNLHGNYVHYGSINNYDESIVNYDESIVNYDESIVNYDASTNNRNNSATCYQGPTNNHYINNELHLESSHKNAATYHNLAETSNNYSSRSTSIDHTTLASSPSCARSSINPLPASAARTARCSPSRLKANLADRYA
jgi:hypothetical protein